VVFKLFVEMDLFISDTPQNVYKYGRLIAGYCRSRI